MSSRVHTQDQSKRFGCSQSHFIFKMEDMPDRLMTILALQRNIVTGFLVFFYDWRVLSRSCTHTSYLSVFNLGGVLCCSLGCDQNSLYQCCFYIILVFRGPWPSIYYPERARRCALPPLGFPYRHMEWQEVPGIVNLKTCNRS